MKVMKRILTWSCTVMLAAMITPASTVTATACRSGPDYVTFPFSGGFDAATNVPDSVTDVYLFRGDQYLRYNTKKQRVRYGPMRIINGWPGLADTRYAAGVDATVFRPGYTGELWFFREGKYIRYKIGDEKIVKSETSVDRGWTGLVGTGFGREITAVVNHPSKPGIMWIFDNSEYVRYDEPTNEVIVGPQQITRGWPGLRNTGFDSGIQAAINIPGNTSDILLFQGDRYIRYNTRTETAVAGGFIVELWPGLTKPTDPNPEQP